MKVTSASIRLPPIAIIVTKADLIDVQYQDVVNSALHQKFSAIFNAPERLVLQVAVSLGGPIEPGFKPDLFCIEQPIAFAVLTIFINHIKEARDTIKENADFFREHQDDFFKPKKELRRARQNIRALQERITIESDHSLNLLNLFSAEKIIYVGGNEKNFHNYFKARLHISTPTIIK